MMQRKRKSKAKAVKMVGKPLDKWDARFMDMAKLVSTWSKDPSSKIGAVLVSPDRTDIIVGYNGFPRGTDDSDEIYANRPLKYSKVVHAEMNAVILARRSVAGYTLYTYPFLSCDRCATHMNQAGIVRVVAPVAPDDVVVRWGDSFKLARQHFKDKGVEVIEYDLGTMKIKLYQKGK